MRDQFIKYVPKEPVILWANKVGPYHNPLETYSYYQLPFCKAPVKKVTAVKDANIGEVLEGNDLQDSNIVVAFQSRRTPQPLLVVDVVTVRFCFPQRTCRRPRFVR